MKFSYTILYVEDVEASLKFYEKAFGFKQKFITPEKDYGELETGETALSFISKDLANSNLPEGFEENSLSKSPAGMEIAFITDNLEEAFKKAVEAGATVALKPTKKPWGQTIAYVRDIDGILVELGNHME